MLIGCKFVTLKTGKFRFFFLFFKNCFSSPNLPSYPSLPWEKRRSLGNADLLHTPIITMFDSCHQVNLKFRLKKKKETHRFSKEEHISILISTKHNPIIFNTFSLSCFFCIAAQVVALLANELVSGVNVRTGWLETSQSGGSQGVICKASDRTQAKFNPSNTDLRVTGFKRESVRICLHQLSLQYKNEQRRH